MSFAIDSCFKEFNISILTSTGFLIVAPKKN